MIAGTAVLAISQQWLHFETGKLGPLLLQMLLATLLGSVVAMLYRLSRPAEERTHGFWHTLVLLAPLIAMVTKAVGDNAAAAFTLVGTLAIVRFRTVVRDSRDTVFVIFSVAIGLAVGMDALVVAATGAAVMAAAILVLRSASATKAELNTGVLRLQLHPPECPDSVWRPIVAEYATTCLVQRSTVDRKREQLELRLGVTGVDPERGIALVQRLLALPEVAQASYTAAEDEFDGQRP